MDAAAAAPQAGYGALVRQLSRQLSRQSSLDDAAFNLVDLPGELLALILYRLLLAHDIAQLAPLCSALRDAARLVFIARPYSREVRTLSGHAGYVRCAAAADDGHVLTGSFDKTVKVWRGDELVRTIEPHTDVVFAVAVLPGGARFISGSEDRTAKLCTFGGGLERTFEVGSVVRCVAVLPDGVHFVVGLGNSEVRLYHVDGTLVHTFKGHASFVNAVTVTPDGQHIISGGSTDKLVKVWSVASKSLVSTCGEEDNEDPSIGHTDLVEAVTAMPDGQRFLSGSNDGEVRVWLLDGTLENTFKLHTTDVFLLSSAVKALVALPDNQHALSGSWEKTVKLFNVNDGAVMRTFTHHTEAVRCLALLPDGLRFVSGSFDDTARIAYHGLALV